MPDQMKPLRIIHSEAATGFGGQERRIFKEMLAMRERGHHMEAICQPNAQLAKHLTKSGFKVHTLPMKGTWNYLKGLFKIRRILKQGRFDVLNTHSRIDTMLAGAAGRLAGTPLIVRTRHLARKPNSLISYTGIPHRVTTTSEYVRRILLDRNVAADKVVTTYSPVDIKLDTKSDLVRQELSLSESDIIVGCVAVLRKLKGLEELISAMRPLLEANSKLHLVIVGGGMPMFSILQELIKSMGLQRQIHLLGVRSDVPDLLAGFDIFALATREEASGTVFVEAGAAGLPIVATNVGGVSETFENGKGGFLVELDDEAGLTEALRKLIDNQDLRHEMGKASKDFYVNSGRFTVDGLVKTTENCYRRWLQELSK